MSRRDVAPVSGSVRSFDQYLKSWHVKLLVYVGSNGRPTVSWEELKYTPGTTFRSLLRKFFDSSKTFVSLTIDNSEVPLDTPVDRIAGASAHSEAAPREIVLKLTDSSVHSPPNARRAESADSMHVWRAKIRIIVGSLEPPIPLNRVFKYSEGDTFRSILGSYIGSKKFVSLTINNCDLELGHPIDEVVSPDGASVILRLAEDRNLVRAESDEELKCWRLSLSTKVGSLPASEPVRMSFHYPSSATFGSILRGVFFQDAFFQSFTINGNETRLEETVDDYVSPGEVSNVVITLSMPSGA
jgi:hypothetical protein